MLTAAIPLSPSRRHLGTVDVTVLEEEPSEGQDHGDDAGQQLPRATGSGTGAEGADSMSLIDACIDAGIPFVTPPMVHDGSVPGH